MEPCHHIKIATKPGIFKLDQQFQATTPNIIGTSARTNTSDYETCNVAEIDKGKTNILTSFIHCDDLFKNRQNTIICQNVSMKLPIKKQDEFTVKSWADIKTIHYQGKREDSGYLSTDSNDSQNKVSSKEETSVTSETDESLGDGHSESGAESIETHSVFFGSYRKSSFITGSVDSGVGSELKPVKTMNIIEDCGGSTDSETVSYATIVPLGSSRSSISSRSSLLVDQ